MTAKSKILVFGIAGAIVLLLILSPPANAFILGFTISDPIPNPGETVELEFEAEVESGEKLDIQNFKLLIEGPESISCLFDTNGTEISGCDSLEIELISLPDLEFGYGYGYFLPGKLRYNALINSSSLDPGIYQVKIIASLPESDFESSEQQLIIIAPGTKKGTCSLRAHSGISSYKDFDLQKSRNRLSLFKTKKDAASGQGELVIQKGRTKIFYEFTVNDAYFVDSSLIAFETSGSIKDDRKPFETESAIAVYNTDTSELTISGSKFSVSSMKVNFARC